MTYTEKNKHKKGNKPTHNLCVKSYQLGNPNHFRIAPIWENQTNGFMNVLMPKLIILPASNSEHNKYLAYVETKYYGKDILAQVGEVTIRDSNDGFEIDFADMSIYPNNNSTSNQDKS